MKNLRTTICTNQIIFMFQRKFGKVMSTYSLHVCVSPSLYKHLSKLIFRPAHCCINGMMHSKSLVSLNRVDKLDFLNLLSFLFYDEFDFIVVYRNVRTNNDSGQPYRQRCVSIEVKQCTWLSLTQWQHDCGCIHNIGFIQGQLKINYSLMFI